MINALEVRRLLVSVAALALGGASAFAQTFPDRPIKLIIGFGAGSAADVASRILAESMGKRLGRPVILEIRAGASSNIAADAVVKSPPDGYSLFLGSVANITNRAMKLGGAVDLSSDMKPVTLICEVPNILVVHPNVKAASIRELIALAKAEPGKLNYGSAGLGSTTHLSGELFNAMAGTRMVHVPYKGTAQATQDLVGETLHVMFAPSSTVLGLIEAKQLRALGWTSATRSAMLPDLPTVAEAALPGYETALWFGINGPAGLPDAVRDRLSDSADAALKSDDVVTAFRAQGIEPLAGGPAVYAKYIADETKKWSDLVVSAGLLKP